jgi:ATP phosphoribosyltransferase regulatory subunit
MIDLSMARRLSYYTGLTFRAYTRDFGQPLLGGGRYDGALLPAAAGFSLGLERLMRAASAEHSRAEATPLVLSLDDSGARALRAGGVRVVRALTTEVEAARVEAGERRIPFLLVAGRLEPLTESRAELPRLEAILRAAGEAAGA